MNKVIQYKNVQVLTADRVRLVIMLYEGLKRFNKAAMNAIEEGDVQGRTENINRSIDILAELSGSLDMDSGGEIASNLLRLYDFSMNQLVQANLTNDAAPIEAVNRIFEELKKGWEAVSKQDVLRESIPAVSISYGA